MKHLAKWTMIAAAAAGMAGSAPAQTATRITGCGVMADCLVLTFEGPGTTLLGTASLDHPDWVPVDGMSVSGNSATAPMGACRFFAVAGDGVPAENSAGFATWTVPAGKLQIVSVPFVNPSSEDGAFKFGDLEIARNLVQGSSVLFWDAGRQGWSGGAKSARGWAAAQANRVIAPGEGFFVQSPAAGTWVAARPYASAVPPASGGGRP